MSQPSGGDDSLVLSYLGIRKAVGIIGIALPFVVALGALVVSGLGLQSSVSAYYYTVMRDVFVGSMCAIAVFLMSYRGYDSRDRIAGNLACAFALGVALFPTTPESGATPTDLVFGWLHVVCAAFFLLVLAYFSLRLFRLSEGGMTDQKKRRNVVYTVCGYVILACLVLAAVVKLLGDDSPIKQLSPIFWLEATAIVAFGVSWFTKGEAILKDR